MVWFGGGFGIGMTSTPTYDGITWPKGVVLLSVAGGPWDF
jgi:hypothetical protein